MWFDTPDPADHGSIISTKPVLVPKFHFHVRVVNVNILRRTGNLKCISLDLIYICIG